jgi:hypothetical protein
MRLISRSAQAVVSFVGIPHPALAYMSGIVVCHLGLRSSPGGDCSRRPFILRIFLVDMKVRSTIGYLNVCVKRGRAPHTSLPPDLLRADEHF